MIQGESLNQPSLHDDLAREKAMRLLHGFHRLHVQKYSETMLKLQKRDDKRMLLDDDVIVLPGVECTVRPGGFIQDRWLPGDFVKLDVPACLHAGFRLGASPDDFDAPILPLLRCIGSGNMIRIISALMCERRVIFVSESVPRLSSCVRAASALLAQGQLTWRYNMVPILPPHLLSCLSEKEPYLIGLLDEFMRDVELLKSLSEVLCIHLDKNQFKTFAMRNPSVLIPDILTKSGMETAAHILHNDMQQILKAEARIWGASDEAAETADPVPKKRKSGKKRETVEVDMFALFNKVMRGDALGADNDIESADSSLQSDGDFARLDDTCGHLPRSQRGDPGAMSIFDVCENARGEEGLRAALTFFFLVTHGDLGAILSQGQNGTFFLDRKKYLLHKKNGGDKESSPLFSLYKQFSGSAMLEHHLSQRIEEFERGKSLSMPRHRSLFLLCEKHLRLKKLEFSYNEIRKVVSQTVLHSPRHALVEKSELARARALTLTSAQPFEGSVSQALSSLMQDSHECDCTLPQVMGVIWSRLDERKPSSWQNPLLALNLLRNLLMHGVSFSSLVQVPVGMPILTHCLATAYYRHLLRIGWN
jgi:DENN (AEX-3) domain/ENTH domain